MTEEAPEAAAVERVTLPGFSIELPKGNVVMTSKSPTSGKHKVALPSPPVMARLLDDAPEKSSVSVHWTSRPSESREEWKRESLPIYLDTMSTFIPGAKVLREEIVDENRFLTVVGTEDAPVALGVIRCDPRFEVEFIYGRIRNVDVMMDLSRSMLLSVRCDVREENRMSLLAATRLPPELGQVPVEIGQHFRSIDGEHLVLNFTSGDLPKESKAFRASIAASLNAMFGVQIPDSQLVTIPRKGSARVEQESLTRARLPDKDELVYFGTLFCKPEGSTLIAIWIAPQPTDALAWERLDQVDCPGAESTPTPSFSSLLDSACLGGNKAACKLRDAPAKN